MTTNKEQTLQSNKVFQVCSLFNEKSEQFKNTKVTSELVVDVQPKEISIALLEDKALVEFQKEGEVLPSMWEICIWDG